ncbi:hypothetical protein QQS21_011888 [Conoideocrella luteorostrata]|uniref:Uncharacterized protein n=1 Tax=Conoideocrella luteorostrata TaxID=1105319 RepID=A0AAJ0FN55_9HYPO|nr:hypothetical protein QQS21_011888 [Conoideocrella luteorostrata]
MKHYRLSMLLWTILLLLLAQVTSRLDVTWDRRGNVPSTIEVLDPIEDPPAIVWRGDTRSPETIYRAGGFSARKNPISNPLDEEKASSLYWHSQGVRPDITKYISTSTNPEVAYQFSSDLYSKQKTFGHVFKISADSKFVDVPKSLGRHIRSGYADQLEHASVADIPTEQIEGSYPAEKLGKKEIEMLKKGHKLEHIFQPNPAFNANKYKPLRGSGARPDLGGLPENSPAYREHPWSQFKGKKVSESLREFQKLRCKEACLNDKGVTFAEVAEGEEIFVAADPLGIRDLSGALQAGEVPEGLASYEVMEAGSTAEYIEATAELEAAEAAEAVEAVEALEAGEIAALGVEGALIIDQILLALGII